MTHAVVLIEAERDALSTLGGKLALLGLSEIPLRLDDEKVRRHAHFESLAFGIEPLFGKLSTGPRRLYPLRIHLNFPAGVADLLWAVVMLPEFQLIY